MFGTAVRQIGFAWSMLSGRRFRLRDVTALAQDMRVTIERFGAPGEGADDLLAAADPDLQRQLAQRRLRHTVRRAAAESPYYRRLFADAGIDPASVTPQTLQALPPTRKETLRGLPSAFVSDAGEPAYLAHTTGTTGTPTLVWFSEYEVELMAAMGAFSLMMAGGLRREHVWANAISSRSMAQIVTARAVSRTGAAFVHLGIVDPVVALDRLATPLHLPGRRAQITHLNLNASYLGALVQEAERGGWSARDFDLEGIWSGGEVLTDALRIRAERVLGAPVHDGYSMTEIAPVGGEVCADGHLHLTPDQGLVEVLDPATMRPAEPGALGVLVVTPFSTFRDTTLLLRYVTGDVVRALAEPAVCDRAAVPATSRIMGRLLDGHGLTTRDVLDVLQSEPELPLPTRFALDDTVLYVVADKEDPVLRDRLHERLADRVSRVVLVDDADALPAACPVRADLVEHSFERLTGAAR